ncbi:MAG: SUMF1/EgtB/PvdO family nonheme iron enzyme [Paludibacteraceae bacterium]|nr:SUMF1/EgtB/PvdO family nonheme iron enzyme [Paludibacteraceae bacterium]
MKKIVLLFLLSTFFLVSYAQVKKVAILETVDKVGDVSYGILFQVRSSLTHAISNSPGYEGYDRVDMSAIMGEHNFQRTGMVSDSQIKQLGQMTGAAYVLIAEAAIYDEQNIIIAAKILDVEKGGVIASTPPSIANKDPMKMAEACKRICASLVGGNAGQSYNYSSNLSYTSQSSYGGYSTGGTNMTINLPSGDSFVMVYVQGGQFSMGCTNDQQGGCESNESPAHFVTINDFYMGETEVTQGMWQAVMGTSIYQQRDKANRPEIYGVGSNYPMYYVNHSEAEEFCGRLNNLLRSQLPQGYKFRLPTEAQWEYAARGGIKDCPSLYAGSDYIGEVAWYDGNSNNSTHPVKTKDPNELGLYDMSGNVWEWCADWYNSSYYSSSPTDNPKNLSSGSDRVYRGGCWLNGAASCCVAFRGHCSPGDRASGLGFRLVLVQD